MKAVFVYDHKFVYDNDSKKHYDGSGGVFNWEMWNRYLSIFDELVVVGRKINALPNKLVLSETENVSFRLIDDLRSNKDRFYKKRLVQRKLKDVIKDKDFVIIRLHSTLGYWALEICKELNIKYVLEIVGDPYDAYWNHSNILGKLIAPVEALKLKMTVKRAKGCIYVTQQYLQSKYPTSGRQVGISNVKLTKLIDPLKCQTFYERQKDVYKLGLIGTFHVRSKGQIELLYAAKEIRNSRPDLKFKIFFVGTGDHSWAEELVRKLDISDLVNFVGVLNSGDDGIYPFLDSVDLYVHPSKSEGLPRVVLEAMSRGRICLASSTAGTPEIIQPEYLHKPGDWRQLAAQIIAALELSSDAMKKISYRNIETASTYLFDVLQKKRELFINDLINEV